VTPNRYLLSFACLVLPPLLRADPSPAAPSAGGATPIEWSLRLARDEIARRGDTLDAGVGKARWDYTTGLFDFALIRLTERIRDDAFARQAEKTIGSFIAPDGSIRTYHGEEFNLDMVMSGRALLPLWDRTHDARYRTAAARLREQLSRQPRTAEGGFWHKQRYPDQMWLDGLYMASPFYAECAARFGEPAAFDDIARQIQLVARHTYNPSTGLFHHGWDAAHRQPWADPATGISPEAWGRSEGWLAMALVDVLDQMPGTHPDTDAIVGVLGQVADGLIRWQDPATGLWWQILDKGGRPGNYLESSASSMFVYALAHAVNRGYLPRSYAATAEKGYAGLIRDLVKVDASGRVSLTQICEVGGLGYTTAAGRPRDGTFEYYISEPVVANDLKGVGPFILAGIEVDRLQAARQTEASTARGWAPADEIVARIRAPEFPERDFPITDFGAAPGGEVDCTRALRAAIGACHAAGGGHVQVPAGVWRTGAICLLSGVDLHLDAGATLRFSAAPADYLPVVFTRWEGTECMNYSALIYAFEQEDIAVTGAGGFTRWAIGAFRLPNASSGRAAFSGRTSSSRTAAATSSSRA
jgi:unsaturated rhamnogalacturonyl hydrolase